MNDKHRHILRNHWSSLRRDLEPIKLLPYLVKVLDVADEQEVKMKSTREDSSDKLLEILPRRGPNAFDDFVNALQEVQPHLALTLLQASGNQHCSHCEALEEECNLLTTERDFIKEKKEKLEEEIKEMNHRIKELGENHLREKQTLQKKLQGMKDEHESLLRDFEKELQKRICGEQQSKEMKSVLQGQNEDLKDQINKLKSSMPGRVLNYRKDFDRHGVLYAIGTNFGTTPWVNPGSINASPTTIIVTRSSDDQGDAIDLLENRRGTTSGTEDKQNSWWCVDLTEKYALYLTKYTLRHGRDNGMSIIRNWRLEGSLDGRIWKSLKKHENDCRLKDPFPYYTATWAVDGELGAFRYFRIFQTGKNSSGSFSIFLSGIELYGVLIEMAS